ncbi:hypothetical protein LTR53_016218 [Teratosphaeriaceae sp. CCFEE 6253]|nr:hypothetical protein LTR53_016218 [Teratosphaeriaceae sp. CCFEE 6253]
MQAFDYFRDRAATQLAGQFDAALFQRLILQASHEHSAVLHACLAVGFMYRAHGARSAKRPITTIDTNSEHHRNALIEYGHAVAELRAWISVVAKTEIALLVCILLVCFEMLQGRQEGATSHLTKGLAVLFGYLRPYARTAGRRFRPVSVSATATKTLDILLSTFVRLDYEATLFTAHDPYLAASLPIDLSSDTASSALFDSVDEAKRHLDVLTSEILRYRSALLSHARLVYDEDGSLFADWAHRYAVMSAASRSVDHAYVHHQQEKLNSCLAAWSNAFEATPGDPEDTARLQLQMQCFYARMLVTTMRETHECLLDRFESTFATIIGLAERYITRHTGPDDSPTFNISPCVIPALYLIGMKCRASAIRRKAISLLRNIPFHEGWWQGAPFAVFLEQLADAEEQRARLLDTSNASLAHVSSMTCADIPEMARYTDVVFAVDAVGALTRGRLVCARYAHESDGGLVLEEHRFIVARTAGP